ncbi:hypothetical protein AVEN_208036-1 [Araneus ventricosus]|uniref:Peptidase aspartic putative domain-containing protein n=1 Tax=Araneus ventricosus TaxID=182803 RepID=A0A4Y2EZY7_ARAVE|nr:hypothetical protein AVEN_208036-1 [Araneus ventricosus]
MSVLDQPKICTFPRVRDKHFLSEFENHGIILTDIGKETHPLRLLLVADVLGRILLGRIEVLKSSISAIETSLGWSVLGSEKTTVVNIVTLCLQNFEIPKILELEKLGIIDPTERKTTKLLEDATLAPFKETVTKTDHRYEVALPWLAGHPPVNDMYDVTESRLRSVTKRLLLENIFEAYDDVLRQWQRDGQPSSATTEVRPVFDASFKRPGYATLNECLSVELSLSKQISPLLLRFRSGAIGVIADIKQVFSQLRVRPEDHIPHTLADSAHPKGLGPKKIGGERGPPSTPKEQRAPAPRARFIESKSQVTISTQEQE